MHILSPQYKDFLHHLIVTKTQQGQCLFIKAKKLIFFSFPSRWLHIVCRAVHWQQETVTDLIFIALH